MPTYQIYYNNNDIIERSTAVCYELLNNQIETKMTETNGKFSYRRDIADRRWLHRSRSFKVTDFGTDRKPVYDFLLVINIQI